jgi:integrase
MESVLLDVAGHRRSPATMPGYHRGRPPRNKGEQYPADPPTVEEIIAAMRTIDDRGDGHRLRALIVLLWRAGLRISEALALQESDLDRSRGAVLIRRGKGGKRREVGMDRWAWEHSIRGWRSVASSRSAPIRRRYSRLARSASTAVAGAMPTFVTVRNPDRTAHNTSSPFAWTKRPRPVAAPISATHPCAAIEPLATIDSMLLDSMLSIV